MSQSAQKLRRAWLNNPPSSQVPRVTSLYTKDPDGQVWSHGDRVGYLDYEGYRGEVAGFVTEALALVRWFHPYTFFSGERLDVLRRI